MGQASLDCSWPSSNHCYTLPNQLKPYLQQNRMTHAVPDRAECRVQRRGTPNCISPESPTNHTADGPVSRPRRVRNSCRLFVYIFLAGVKVKAPIVVDRPNLRIRTRSRSIEINRMPILMGILNVTP